MRDRAGATTCLPVGTHAREVLQQSWEAALRARVALAASLSGAVTVAALLALCASGVLRAAGAPELQWSTWAAYAGAVLVTRIVASTLRANLMQGACGRAGARARARVRGARARSSAEAGCGCAQCTVRNLRGQCARCACA